MRVRSMFCSSRERAEQIALPVVVIAAALPGGAAPVPLVATSADESSPSGNGTDLAWTVGSTEAPVVGTKLGAVFVRHGDAQARRITPAGVLAASGGMDARTLVVQFIRDGNSDLKLYDLRTHRFREPPRGVNTRAWEWRGSVSGRWLLFGRLRVAGNGHAYDVVLADLRTGRERLLDSDTTHAPYAEPGQVNGRYAVWVRAPERLYTVHRYDIATGAQVRVDGDYDTAAFAPSVAPDGVVYYGRSPNHCGAGVKIVRWRPGGGRHLVATLPDGYDLQFTSFDGKRVLFDRFRCSGGSFDVYAVAAD